MVKNEHKKLSNKRDERKIKRQNEKAKMTIDDNRESQKKRTKESTKLVKINNKQNKQKGKQTKLKLNERVSKITKE